MDAVIEQPTTPAPTAPAAPATVAEPSTKFSIADFRKAKEAPKADPAPVAAPPADEDDEPDVIAEIDKVEAPAPEETPQEMRARRNRNRRAAQKAAQTRVRNERDAARQRIADMERELAARPRPAPEPARQPVAARELAPGVLAKPSVKDFPLEKFKDEDDPYQAQSAALAEAIADWRWQQRDAESRDQRQREERDRATETSIRAHEARVTEAKTRYPDYDAVVAAAQFRETPATPDLLTRVYASPYSADLVYYLSTHRDETERLLASPTREALIEGLAEIKATVSAALKAKPPATAPKVNATPPPTQPVSSGPASGALLRNPYEATGTKVSIRELRAHRAATGR